MANVPPPNSRAPRLPAPPPPVSAAPQNMATPNGDKMVDMNFKVPAAMHKRVKMEAFQRGMSMKELVEAALRFYIETNPVEHKTENW